jgi:phospholipid-binding lipoprotein MlaA
MKPHVWAIVVLAVAITGCAASEKNPSSNHLAAASDDVATLAADDDFDLLEDELEEQPAKIADPLEPLNRLMHGLNDILYDWVAKPCAEGCKAVIPEPARIGISNFFNNVATPIRFVNCLLQGKGDAAGTELDRFLVNTTVGILGFGDPARDQYGLEPVQEDLGQTLGVHGLGNGPYIVWPLLGPSSLRDSAGMLGDLFLNPIRYVEPTETAIGISVGKAANEGTFHIGEYDAFRDAAVDPYIAMRQAYIQYREKQVEE